MMLVNGDTDDADDDDHDHDDVNGVVADTLQNILKFSLPRRTLTSTIRCHKWLWVMRTIHINNHASDRNEKRYMSCWQIRFFRTWPTMEASSWARLVTCEIHLCWLLCSVEILYFLLYLYDCVSQWIQQYPTDTRHHEDHQHHHEHNEPSIISSITLQ